MKKDNIDECYKCSNYRDAFRELYPGACFVLIYLRAEEFTNTEKLIRVNAFAVTFCGRKVEVFRVYQKHMNAVHKSWTEYTCRRSKIRFAFGYNL